MILQFLLFVSLDVGFLKGGFFGWWIWIFKRGIF
jgi:hypothetical protein